MDDLQLTKHKIEETLAGQYPEGQALHVALAAIERAIEQNAGLRANSYQAAAARTLIMEPDTTFTNEELAIMLAALELGAKVGAVCDYVKKSICHRHGFDARELHGLLCEMAIADIDLRVTSVGGHDRREYRLSGNDQMLIWCALGLGGEAGEVMEGASMLQYGKISTDAMVKELGDNDWYNAAICTLLGVQMSDVMQANIDKLKKRFPEGWGSEASKARVDTL